MSSRSSFTIFLSGEGRSSDAMVTARSWSSVLCLGYSLRSSKMLPENIRTRALLVCLNWMHNTSFSGTHTLVSLDWDSTGATGWPEDISLTTLSGRDPQGAARLFRGYTVKFKLFFFYLFIFNWRKIASQYCVSLCYTSTWVRSNEVDEPRAYDSEWSKSERENHISYINTYIWNLERWYWCTSLQGNSGDADMENRLMDTGGWAWVGKRGWDKQSNKEVLVFYSKI